MTSREIPFVNHLGGAVENALRLFFCERSEVEVTVLCPALYGALRLKILPNLEVRWDGPWLPSVESLHLTSAREQGSLKDECKRRNQRVLKSWIYWQLACGGHLSNAAGFCE